VAEDTRVDDMPSLERIVWHKLRVKRGDKAPYCGFGATRDALAELFAELGYTLGAEIGVCRGHYSETLCKKNPRLKLLCVDPWAPYALRTEQVQQAHCDEATARLAKYDVTIIKKASMEAVKDVADGSLDFVYIDADHLFESVILDIIHWSRKVRVGGIVSGHDYCCDYQSGVMAAVDAYVKGTGIQTWYVTIHDHSPSWLWLKRR